MKRKILLTALMLVFISSVSALAQNVTYRFQVVSKCDETALPGVSVFQTGTTNGATTDIYGVAYLTVPAGTSVSITVSAIGYLPVITTIHTYYTPNTLFRVELPCDNGEFAKGGGAIYPFFQLGTKIEPLKPKGQ